LVEISLKCHKNKLTLYSFKFLVETSKKAHKCGNILIQFIILIDLRLFN